MTGGTSATESHEPTPIATTGGSLVDSLAIRARSDEPAFTYLDHSDNRDAVPRTLTWFELHVRICAVAAQVRETVEPSACAAVLYPQDPSYSMGFLASLAGEAIAVPLFAAEVGSHNVRLSGALADCEATVWLTTEAMLD